MRGRRPGRGSWRAGAGPRSGTGPDRRRSHPAPRGAAAAAICGNLRGGDRVVGYRSPDGRGPHGPRHVGRPPPGGASPRRSTMRASTITTLIAALGLTVAGAAAALAGEYRGSLEGVDTAKNTLSVTGVTIQANGYPIANLDPTANYVVTWQSQGGQNVLTDIQPDNSGGSRHK